MEDFVENRIIQAVRCLLSDRVNAILQNGEFVVPVIEFGEYHGDLVITPCVQKPGVMIRVKELYVAYQKWCADNNERVASEKYISLRLQEIGFERTRTAEARYWKNIGLKADAP